MLNEPKAEPLSPQEVHELDNADALVVPINGYVIKVGTMASTFAIEEWDGSIIHVSIPSRVVLQAYQETRGNQEKSEE